MSGRVLLGLLFAACVALAVGCSAPAGLPSSQGLQPAGDFGSVTGVLLDTGGEPIAGVAIFVADLTPGAPTGEKIITFSPSTSPRANTDDQGRFDLSGVKPGNYALAVWTPGESLIVPPSGGKAGSALFFDVVGGQKADLGTLKVTRPR